MRNTILIIGSVTGGIVALIGYILAIITTIKNKSRDDNITMWNLWAKLNIASLAGFIIVFISFIVSSLF